MLIRAKDASFAATHPTGIAVIHQVGNIDMGTVTANASGAATKPTEAIAVTHPTASTNCKQIHKALRGNLIAYPLRGGQHTDRDPARLSRSETKQGHREQQK